MATRRQFLGSTILGSLAAALMPASAPHSPSLPTTDATRAAAANAELKRYVTMASAAQAAPTLDA